MQKVLGRCDACTKRGRHTCMITRSLRKSHSPFLHVSTTDKCPMIGKHQSNDEKLRLPDTILMRIFSYLDPQSLARATSVSHQFQELAYSDEPWKIFVNSYLPTQIESCKPAPSFRRLFIAFHPYWFVPRFRFWLSDEYLHGQLPIAQFNIQKLCIEACAVVADREDSKCQPWTIDTEVMIHESDMRAHIDQQHLLSFALESKSRNGTQMGKMCALRRCTKKTPRQLSRGWNCQSDMRRQGRPSSEIWVCGQHQTGPHQHQRRVSLLVQAYRIHVDHQALQRIVIPLLAFITTALTRPSHMEQCPRRHTHPVLKSHGKASGAETTLTTAWSYCWCYNPIRLIACWQSN
jgi:hypothetical protein